MADAAPKTVYWHDPLPVPGVKHPNAAWALRVYRAVRVLLRERGADRVGFTGPPAEQWRLAARILGL